MTVLNDELLAELRHDLEALRAELEGVLEMSTESARTVELDQPIGRLSRMDALQQQGLAAAHRKRHEVRLRQVLAALRAMREGEYGACRRCDEPIALDRLRARPETPICVACREEMEG